MVAVTLRKERFLNIPPRPFVINGCVVRTPKAGVKGYFGYIQWGELHVYVRSNLIKPWKEMFVERAVVSCTVVWSEERNQYQAVQIHNVTLPL